MAYLTYNQYDTYSFRKADSVIRAGDGYWPAQEGERACAGLSVQEEIADLRINLSICLTCHR